MNRYQYCAALLLFVAATVPGSMAFAAERQLSLSEAVAAALQGNHNLRASKNSLLAQKEEIGVARSPLLPHVAFEERASRTDNPPGVFMSKLNQQRFAASDFAIQALNSPKAVSDLQSLVSVDQAVFAAGAYVGLDMAKKEFAAQTEDFGRKHEETVVSVVQNYLQIRTAKEYVRVAHAGLDDAKEHLRIAESRQKNGVGLVADVLRARTAAIEAEQRIITSEKNLSVAKRALGLLLGLQEPIDIADDAPRLTMKDPQYYETAASSRKDLRAMRIRADNAANGVRLANSRYLPTVGVRASYQWNDQSTALGSQGESWWLMGVLRWELFDGAGREYERNKARHRQNETKERLEGMTRYISFRVNEAYLSAREAEKNAELSRAGLATAEEGRRLVKGRYENSLSPVVDLLDVQLTVDHARANVVAKENEYRLAMIRLAQEGGTILDDLGMDQVPQGGQK
jgi:outer membrane protein